jgi:hypothetical protein
VGQGELRSGGWRILVLPHTIALDPREAKEIRGFVEQGGIIVADGQPGLFDGHGRQADTPLLSEVFRGPPTRSATSSAFGKGVAVYLSLSGARRRDAARRLTDMLDAGGVKPPFPLVRSNGRAVSDVETYIFNNGAVTIVALQRDFVDPSSPDSRESIALLLPWLFNVYDLRARRGLGKTDRLELELGAVEPLVLAFSEQPLAPPFMAGPSNAHLGANVRFSIRSDNPAALDIVHLDVIDPNGNAIAHYSGNLVVSRGAAARQLPLALNDKTGVWTIRAGDLISGQTATAELTVEP